MASLLTGFQQPFLGWMGEGREEGDRETGREEGGKQSSAHPVAPAQVSLEILV